MKLLLTIALSFYSLAHASLPELFGTSASSIAVGSQAQKESAANNYHAAALLGYSQNTQFSFDTFYINTSFLEIKNVTISNQTNTVNQFETGDVKVNSTPTTMIAAHLSTPLFAPTGPKLNLSLFAPADRIMEADSGDPYQPHYVMYKNRFIRPVFLASAAQNYGDWSFSAGIHTGFQSNGETYFITRTTSGDPSLARISFNAKPSIGALASLSKKTNNHTTYLSFQQEMKSRLKNRATGETGVASNTSFQFDFDVDTLLYYDPMTLRLGHQIDAQSTQLFFSLEFQQWENYESQTLELKQRAGSINGSKNFESLKLKNILIPKFGLEQKITNLWSAKFGYFYRPSPIETTNLENAGNTIDVDKRVASVGIGRMIRFYQKDLNLDLAYQAHFLRKMNITKTPGREDNDPSQPKIGSPGYKVGGMIHVVSLGLSWMY